MKSIINKYLRQKFFSIVLIVSSIPQIGLAQGITRFSSKISDPMHFHIPSLYLSQQYRLCSTALKSNHDPKGSCAKMYEPLLRLANSGNAYAQYLIGTFYDFGVVVKKNYQKAFDWSLKSAKNGYNPAQFIMARMYWNGVGTTKNPKEFGKWIKIAANNGDRSAEELLGSFYLKGSKLYHITKDRNKGLALLKTAATSYALAYRHLGSFYMGSDNEQAIEYFKQAADLNDDYSTYWLAVIYCREKKYQAAYRWFNKIPAHSPYKANAFSWMGALYLEGNGVKKNTAKARQYFKKGADLNDGEAQYMLASLYYREKKYQAAYHWFNKIPDHSHYKAGSFYWIGLMYWSGDGVEKNTVKAIQYLKKSAIRGSLLAMLGLGKVFTLGKDVPKNYDQAVVWLNMAAMHHAAQGLLLLALVYLERHEYKNDILYAYAWSTIAASHHNKEAALWRDKVWKTLNPVQKQKAQKLTNLLYDKLKGVPPIYL